MLKKQITKKCTIFFVTALFLVFCKTTLAAAPSQNSKTSHSIAPIRSTVSKPTVNKTPTKIHPEYHRSSDHFATAEDNQLNQRIRSTLTEQFPNSNYKNINLNTIKGSVTISGKVDNASEKENIVNNIQKIEGVKAVKSNLIVKPPTTPNK